MSAVGLYIDLWTKKRNAIVEHLRNCETKQSIQLNPVYFKSVGNRGKYSFNLEFKDGEVYNNIGGSAVARDLEAVLQRSKDAREALKSGHYKINMDSGFMLWIQKKREPGSEIDIIFDL